MTRATIATVAAILISGCTEHRNETPSDSMIGKRVLVTDSVNGSRDYPIQGKILTVDPSPEDTGWLPTYSPSFYAVVLDEIPEKVIDGEPYPAMWKVCPEDGPAARQVVAVRKDETILTVIK